MAADNALESFENLLKAMELAGDVTQSLIHRVKALEARCGELAEDVAGLHNRVGLIDHAGNTAHSLRVFTSTAEQRLEQVAGELRTELAAEVAEITARIDDVHARALRALTDATERNRS